MSIAYSLYMHLSELNSNWTDLIEYFQITPSYVQTLTDGAVIVHSFSPVGTQALSHTVGYASLTIIDNTGTNIYGSTIFDNTGLATCPLPGVPIELVRDNGQILKTNSAADGSFSFSVALGEPVQLRIPPYNGFSWSSSFYRLSDASTASRRLQSGGVASVPSASAAPTMLHLSSPKLVHRFTFDHTAATNSENVPDIQSDDCASIHNGVVIDHSLAVFSLSANPLAQPYLALPPGLFGASDAISIEMWITVDSATQDDAILFSFGDPTDPNSQIFLNAKNLQGVFNTYVAITVDPVEGLQNVFVNGTLISKVSIPSTPLFDGQGESEHFNSIGWDLKKSTPGFIGSFDEIRLWEGLLSLAAIAETALLGVDPTIVILNTTDTLYNIQIDYLVTTEEVTKVAFFGGLSRNRMFGSESVFLIQALDPQCAYNLTVFLDPYYSATSVLLPAMNYSVTLLPYNTPLPAPKFSPSPVTQCSQTLDPYSYLAAADQLSVQIFTDLRTTYNLYATFIYHTGLCMHMRGSENFATSAPSPNINGHICYNHNTTMLQRGQKWPINITLLELYPTYTGNDPAWASAILDISSGDAVQDVVVLDSIVEIIDVVSGFPAPKTFTYSDAPYSSAFTSIPKAPPTFNYTITAAVPLPTAPFGLSFKVVASRNSPEGVAVVSSTAIIPILGTIPSEVPNFYPVTTDPTLIFLILRDPPGGASTAKIEAGSTFTTSITIDGMKTFEQDIHANTELGAEAGSEELLILAPFGFGFAQNVGNENANIGVRGSLIAPDVSVSRLSETHYSYSFQFSYDFSTSSDPFIAGHPSDVIVGGGIDIIVSETLEGKCCMLH